MGFKLGDKLGGATVEPGLYNIRLYEWSKTTTNVSNKPMIKLQWKIVDGDYEGQLLFDQVVTTEEGIFRACNILSAVGYSSDTEFDSVDECASAMIKALEDDAVLTASVTKKPHPNDRTREVNNIATYFPYSGETQTKGEDNEVPF